MATLRLCPMVTVKKTKAWTYPTTGTPASGD